MAQQIGFVRITGSPAANATINDTPQPVFPPPSFGHLALEIEIQPGAENDTPATPGLPEGRFEYYARAGAWPGGEVLTALSPRRACRSRFWATRSVPARAVRGNVPAARPACRAGSQEPVRIRMMFAMAAPVLASKDVSQLPPAALDERGIRTPLKALVVGLDARGRTAPLARSENVPYDLLIGIPVHHVADVAKRSERADDGWAPIDQTNPSTRFPSVCMRCVTSPVLFIPTDRGS